MESGKGMTAAAQNRINKQVVRRRGTRHNDTHETMCYCGDVLLFNNVLKFNHPCFTVFLSFTKMRSGLLSLSQHFCVHLKVALPLNVKHGGTKWQPALRSPALCMANSKSRTLKFVDGGNY